MLGSVSMCEMMFACEFLRNARLYSDAVGTIRMVVLSRIGLCKKIVKKPDFFAHMTIGYTNNCNSPKQASLPG